MKSWSVKVKVLIISLMLMVSLSVKAENPVDQYCGRVQYGYLWQSNLYTAPLGFGWQFPRPTDATWLLQSYGWLGANNYYLSCKPIQQLPLDDWLLPIVGAVFGSILIKRKYENK